MAARYVDTANIVAQGQSFYTGLLPGSYEKGGGGGGGSNVMGRGSGGSAGVSADRTASEAAGQSFKEYRAGGSIFPGGGESDTDRIVKAIEGQNGQALPTPDPALKDDDPGLSQRFGGDDPEAADSLMPQSERVKWAAAGLPNPPNAPGQQNPFGHDKGLPWGTNQAPKTDPGPMGTGQKPQHGSVQGLASTRSHTRQPGVQQSIPQQAIPSLSVSGAASTRSHTRQSGVQQSATQQSIPFPNMPNSTNRALNF